MRLDISRQPALTNGLGKTGTFDIAPEASAHVIRVLQDYMYEDKHGAVVREYVSNAWDAHEQHGVQRPFEVHAPVLVDPVFRVRDFGPGLSGDDVLGLAIKYGLSSKRHTDDAVGMLGLGMKSAFCYTPAWTLASWYGGVKTTYAIYRGDDGEKCSAVEEVPCGDETGVEIAIPVQDKDVPTFTVKVQKVLMYLAPGKAKANVNVPNLEPAVLTSGGTPVDTGPLVITGGSHFSTRVLVMGPVAYPVDIDNLPEDARLLSACGWRCTAPIGSVDVAASREALQYTAKTIAYLRGVLEQADKAVTAHWERMFDATCTTPWERCVRAVEDGGKVTFPQAMRTTHSVSLTRDKKLPPVPFAWRRVSVDKSKTRYLEASHFNVTTTAKIIEADVSALRRQGAAGYPTCVPGPGYTRAALDAELERLGVAGIPVVQASTLPLDARVRTYEKAPLWVLKPEGDIDFRMTPSQHWKPFAGDPPPGSLCVRLDHGRVHYRLDYTSMKGDNLRGWLASRFRHAELGDVGPIFCVKGKELVPEGLLTLQAFMAARLATLSPARLAELEAWRWRDEAGYHQHNSKDIEAAYPPGHPILRHCCDRVRAWTSLPGPRRDVATHLGELCNSTNVKCKGTVGPLASREALFARYPLLSKELGGVFPSHLDDPRVVAYVQVMDHIYGDLP